MNYDGDDKLCTLFSRFREHVLGVNCMKTYGYSSSQTENKENTSKPKYPGNRNVASLDQTSLHDYP
jgi:hypothetical protein